MKVLFQTAFILLLMSGVASADLMNGLVGWWQMDEGSGAVSTADSSGQGNNGSLQGSPGWVTGKIRSALSFNGSSQYVNIGTTSTYALSTFSFAAWVYPTSSVSWRTIFARELTNNSQRNYWIGLDTGTYTLSLSFSSGGALKGGNSTTNLTANQWNHIVVTFNQPTANYYLNGSFGSTASYNFTPDTTAGWPLNIGFTNGENLYFPGYMDDVRIYNRILTATEVNDLYLIGLHRVQPGNNSTFGTFQTSN